MWKLNKDESNKRTYVNSATGSQCIQSMVYVDKEGNNWYSFDDLLSIPYTRQFAATKISSLYSLGLSKEDLTGFIGTMKAVLKSGDPEKYEKAFASLLDFENKANNATDAIKQLSSLTCVYFTVNDEPIDSFDNNLQIKKMGILEADIEAHSFFLNIQIQATEDYTRRLSLISQIVSPNLNGR
jgi:hypothetical protein